MSFKIKNIKNVTLKNWVSVLVGISLGSSVAFSGANAQPIQTPKELRIGYQKYGTLILLKAKGSLDKRLAEKGVTVKWTEFAFGPPLLEAINVNSIDVGSTGESPPIFAQAAGADIVYIGNEPPAPKGEGLIVLKDSPIKKVADLKGRKVAVAKGSNANYLLVKVLENAGLKYTDIDVVYLTPADARSAFETKAIDAWAIWDPFYSAAEKQLSGRLLALTRYQIISFTCHQDLMQINIQRSLIFYWMKLIKLINGEKEILMKLPNLLLPLLVLNYQQLN